MTMGGDELNSGWRLERFEVVGISVRRFSSANDKSALAGKMVSNGIARSTMTATPNMPDHFKS